jgi:subtilisin family serine protease
MGLKFLDATGSGYLSDAIAVIDFAVKAKLSGLSGANVRVLSNSWACGGTGDCFSQALLDEINAAGRADILFVAAAGNSSVDAGAQPYPTYPCAYTAGAHPAANVICVAATDQNDNLAWFSNYGASAVNLGAPGTNILSTVRGGYAYYNGTSMATPHVSGAAALILSAPGQGNLTVADLKSAILNNVDPLPSLAGRTVTGGRLNVCKAIPGCGSTPTPTVPSAPALSASAGNATVHLSWTTPANGGAQIQGYNVYRGTTSGGETNLITVGVQNAYDDSSAINGTTYYYQVSAVNSVGEGLRSNEVSATPQPPSKPTAPRNLRAASANNGVTLTWQAPSSSGSSSITGYKIYRGTASGKESLLTTVGNVTSYKDTKTTRRVRYYYQVTAVNSAGESPRSNEASATPR